jgi:hypothetical protein
MTKLKSLYCVFVSTSVNIFTRAEEAAQNELSHNCLCFTLWFVHIIQTLPTSAYNDSGPMGKELCIVRSVAPDWNPVWAFRPRQLQGFPWQAS